MQSFSPFGARRPRPVLWTALLASTMLTGVGGVAHAADAPAPSPKVATVEEVVVTAEKREESLQKVSASIQALDTKKLQQLDVTDFGDYSKYLPSLSFQTVAPSATSIYMRGVASGENGNHSGPLPSVGTYLDETPITTIGGTLDVHIYDVARIEALAGPQGTLYGASSEAGTVRIITNQPEIGRWSAAYDLQGNDVAHGGVGGVAEGYINIPINDRMAVRLVAWDEHDAGFIDNVPGTRTFATSGATVDNNAFVKNNFNQVDTMGGRAALRIDLNDNWTVTPSIIGQHVNANGVFGYDRDVAQPLAVQHFGPDTSSDSWYQSALTVHGKVSNFDITYSGGYFWRKLETVSDYMDYAYAYDACCGYGAYWVDNNGVPIPNPRQQITGRDTFSKNSQELRIASPATDRLRFVAGLFYERQTHWIIQDYTIAGLGSNWAVPNWPDTFWLTDQMRVDRDKAAYGEATFDFTDNFSLTAGIRFYDYKNSLEGFYGFSEGTDNPPGLGGLGYSHTGFGPGGINCKSTAVYRDGPGCINLNKVTSGSGNTHRVTATYKFDPDRLVYATWSTGFRPGGVNRNGNLPPYQADELTNYEFGWKTAWMGHRLIWNGAIYQEDWKNFQFSFLGLNSLTVVDNAGGARVRGIESNLVWVATDNLTISAAGAYTDAKLTVPYCGVVDANGSPVTNCPGSELAPVGQQLPVTPKFKGNVTARYLFSLGDWDAHLQGSVVYQDSSWADLRTFERAVEGRMPSYSTADFQFGAERNGMEWELFVKNAFDSRGNVTRYTECTIGVCGFTDVYAVPITPRLIGLKFGQKF
jgi:outer membrane receptor protein involved in Fe transport